MTPLESVFFGCLVLCAIFCFLLLCAGVIWILEKIGFNRWLRGWLWYFGIIDECPDTERDR